MSRLLRVALVLGVVLLGPWTDASAQGRGPSVYERTHPSVLRAFEPIARRAKPSVVQVRSANEVVALGAIVDSDGWIVTKASELASDDAPEAPGLTCVASDGTSWPARLAARDE
ncbi:MAG: hypothetical protein KDC38_15705, partial [Planctomycetes bacterium]|nr:hypothetical protein [Planctomycetota bacterium]